MWFLTTGNLWDGFGVAYHGSNQVYAVISMLLIGYVEEIIFRGFLFRALIPRDGIKAATIISSVTFGIGHIINLLAGQVDIEAVATVFFAIAWGFIFTYVFYKSGSLVPGSIANVKHSSYYVKKFLCPHCGTEQWASVVDIGRLQQKAYDKIFNSLNPLYWYRHKDEIRLADQIWYHIIVIILVMNLCGAVLN